MSEAFEAWAKENGCVSDDVVYMAAKTAWLAALAHAEEKVRKSAENGDFVDSADCCNCLSDSKSVSHACADAIRREGGGGDNAERI